MGTRGGAYSAAFCVLPQVLGRFLFPELVPARPHFRQLPLAQRDVSSLGLAPWLGRVNASTIYHRMSFRRLKYQCRSRRS